MNGPAPLALPVVRPSQGEPDWIARARAPVVVVALVPAPAGAPVVPAGPEEGYAEGLRRAHADVVELRRAAGAAIGEAASLRARLLRETEQDLIDLALAIAAEIAAGMAERDVAAARTLARTALSLLAVSDRVSLRVSARDRARVDEWLTAMPPDPARPEVSAVIDPALGAGEIIAESNLGRVDARIRTRVEQVARALREGGIVTPEEPS